MVCACSVAQSCPTLCDPMDYSLPSFSVHGIFQARILEWVANCIYYYYVWPHCMACGILVPWPRIGPRPPQWKHPVLTYSRSFLIIYFMYTAVYMFITTSWFIRLPQLSPLISISLFSMSVSQFLLGFLKYNFIYWFMFGWAGSSLLRGLFSSCARTSHCRGFSRAAGALGAQASVAGLPGSVVVAHGLSCSGPCGIFLDQGSNPCLPQ